MVRPYPKTKASTIASTIDGRSSQPRAVPIDEPEDFADGAAGQAVDGRLEGHPFERRLGASGASRAPSQVGQPASRRRRLMRCSEPRSGNATNSVSSPAIEPATSGQRARSRAAAMAWAEPGSVRRTSRRPASWISIGRSANSLRRRSSPRGLGLDQARRQGVGGVPSRVTLIRPSSATSREIVACVVRKPARGGQPRAPAGSGSGAGRPGPGSRAGGAAS